jgi:hypothetical protein
VGDMYRIGLDSLMNEPERTVWSFYMNRQDIEKKGFDNEEALMVDAMKEDKKARAPRATLTEEQKAQRKAQRDARKQRVVVTEKQALAC